MECRRVYGETGEETRSWEVSKRYTDFVNLHNALQESGVLLSLPKKKMVGNLGERCCLAVLGFILVFRQRICYKKTEGAPGISTISYGVRGVGCQHPHQEVHGPCLICCQFSRSFRKSFTYFIIARYLSPEMALQHVSMIFRSNPRFEIQKPLPEIGSRIRSLYFLVKDKEEPKIQKLLNWTDFGPYQAMDDRTLQSLAKSFAQIEVKY